MAVRRFAFAQELALTGALILFPLISLSAPTDRISDPIDNHRMVILKGNVTPNAKIMNDRGALEPGTPIHDVRLVLQPSEQQAADLEQFLEEQRNPSSVDYRNWLTPEEYGARFGLGENDLGKLTAWLQSQGFTVDRVARAKNWITFSGTAEQMGRTFGTELHRFEVRSDSGAELHFANATEPSIPAALAGVVSAVRGLDDFRPKPPVRTKLRPEYNGSGSAHYLAPDDLATIYDISTLYQAGFDGTGQKLVIAGQTDLIASDITTFRSQFNLSAKPPQLVLYGADPGLRSGDDVEADLDVEWAGAIARNATIIYVYSANVFESVQYAIDENFAPVISLSYGGCESGAPASYRTMAQQANAEGITWLSASGDSAAAGCDPQGTKSATLGPVVTFPADIPEVTAVGGTEFNEGSGTYWNSKAGPNGGSAMSYIPEKAWNDTPLGQGIEGSGGGASTLFPKPWWQAGPGVPNDSARDVPDVSLSASAAHDGYVMVFSGSLMAVGGTSASTPSFAGIVTLINHYEVAKSILSKAGLGNINPTLYSLAQSNPSVFHDITVGDNIVPCTNGTPGCTTGSFGYKTGTGYDPVTGLGSVDAYKLVTGWASLPPSVGTTNILTVSPASIVQSATTKLTATVKAASGSNAPTGSVTFSDGSASLGSATVVAGTGATGTATLTVNGSALQTGGNTITATYTAAGNFASSTGTATVTVTLPPPVATTTTVSANPTSIASTATTQLTATVKAASGAAAPTGSVTFAIGNTTALGTATLTASGTTSTAVLTVKGSSLNTGNNTISATFVANGNFSTSTASVTVAVTSPAVATTTAVVASPLSIPSTGTTQVTATVKAASGTTSPTGSITFSVGTTSLGSVPLSGGVASLSVKGSSLATGNNTVTASYIATGNFSNSTGSVTVSVTSAVVATTTALTANPTSIASTATTLLTATVKASTGTTTPTGSVTFSLGSTSLGSEPLSNGTASLTVKGSSLATGSNTITASYVATGSFSNSTTTAAVTVTAPAVATTTSVTANPASLLATGSTLLTATVKASTGTAAPAGSVSFTLGNTSLGSATLTTSGTTATATLSVKGSSLSSGSNVITATYSGTSSFSGSSGTVTVTVTAAAASKVVVSATPEPASAQVKGWLVSVQLQEQAGVATTLTGFTINGTDYSALISPAFGTIQLAAHGTLTANLAIQWSPLPSTIVFAFTGVDASGTKWSQSVSASTANAATGK